MKNSFFEIDKRLEAIARDAEKELHGRFSQIDAVTSFNQQKMLHAFIKHRVSEADFAASTGYGYGDRGRDKLEKLFADTVGAQDALIRHNFVSGTHALTVALFGVLRPGESMLCVTGRPYDTLMGVLGHERKTPGSLADFGVTYRQVDLTAGGRVDLKAVKTALTDDPPKMVYIQRSRGYNLRPSLFCREIEEIAALARTVSPDSIILADNCYGEFVETGEPTEYGADLIAGSLIKNPGGGIAPTGGYIAGHHDLIELCAARLTCPGVGREVGASLGHNRELYMGLFHAPHVTGEALKTAVFAAELFARLGFSVNPGAKDARADIIQCVGLDSPGALIAFCQGMQKGAPVDSFVIPEPWDMPGYDNKVIMAAGAFTLGASIELSADAPIKEPYTAFLQGGLNYHSGRTGVLLAAQSMLENGFLDGELFQRQRV